jgi:hypothetical protein
MGCRRQKHSGKNQQKSSVCEKEDLLEVAVEQIPPGPKSMSKRINDANAQNNPFTESTLP